MSKSFTTGIVGKYLGNRYLSLSSIVNFGVGRRKYTTDQALRLLLECPMFSPARLRLVHRIEEAAGIIMADMVELREWARLEKVDIAKAKYQKQVARIKRRKKQRVKINKRYRLARLKERSPRAYRRHIRNAITALRIHEDRKREKPKL